ncbi:protein mono-ADP-ribosyltransferase PARP11 [Echeneis naucrates]|uniref:protein mono-ADP-ribosyltransferase PARP11 n=1 Tax=Echeneis naucrates TaxID=173247 RepID=UPI00111406AD|nr:protein mono-ADP-ribosyltransferase PARP11-like [Echeneis naucrates]
MWHNEDVEYMDTSDTPWSWYYLADCGRWHKFEDEPTDPIQSEAIENFYLKNSKGVLNRFSSACSSKLDFSAMLMTDVTTGQQRRILRSYNIARSCSCYTAPPVFWEKEDPTIPYQLIPLSELTPEYNTVAGYVKKDGLLDKHILSISRIQNLDLWEMYCCKKKQLMRIQGVKGIAERRLFHGTDPKNVDSICKYNFDVRLAGKHGSVYGKGVYFARHATYADNYSKDSTDPLPFYGGGTQSAHGSTRVIFLARVMIGRSTLGQRIFKKPDHGSLENNHESCVDDIKTPKCFVVFDSNQIYPEYLIQYR